MRLRSFKLRFADAHVRAVLDRDGHAEAVDLLGDDAREAFRLAAPLLRAIAVIEPAGKVRSLSMDLERPRLTATLEAVGERRPCGLKVEDGEPMRTALEALPELSDYLVTTATRTLARRGLDQGS